MKRHSNDILEDLGPGIMRSRRRCATLALHTFRAALTQYLLDHSSLEFIAPNDKEQDPILQFEIQSSLEATRKT